MTEKFMKKVYSPEIFFDDLHFLINNISKIIGAFGNKDINRPFIEKIMTVTTAVNGCVYCSWFHAKQALASGISEKEVQDLLNLQFHTTASKFEITALMYAQHYAETDRGPDPEMTSRLFDHYGEETANDILLLIRMITFGNLFGNTWDAVINRLKGNTAEDGNLSFELLFFLVSFLFMVPMMLIIGKSDGSSG